MPHGDDDAWIQTYTGKQFWPLDPRAEDVDIVDIAHSLSMKCRYTGHCRFFYSVAQHSIAVANIVIGNYIPHEFSDKPFALTALLHDAAEAYTADVARPVKHHIKDFAEIEERLEKVIAERFGLIYPFPEIVKTSDNIMLATERRDIMEKPPRPWKTYGVEPMEKRIETRTIASVKFNFLQMFKDLTGKTSGDAGSGENHRSVDANQK